MATIINGTTGNDTLQGTSGDDTIFGNGGLDTIFGGDGNDTICGGSGNDILWGDNSDGTGSGNDIIYGYAGNDTIHGGAGNDFLDGGRGVDFVYGDSGDDTLVFTVDENISNSAKDTYDGGDGNDTLVINISSSLLGQLGLTTQQIENYFDNNYQSVTHSVNFGLLKSSLKLVATNMEEILVNYIPVANNDSGVNYTTNEDTPLSGNVLTNDTDADHNTLTAILVTGPKHGSLTLNADGSFTYTPAPNYNGTDSFTYKANDGYADSNIATVSLTIKAVNDPPVAQVPTTTLTVNEDAYLVFSGAKLIKVTDVDTSSGTVQVTLHVDHGALTLSKITGLAFSVGDGTADADMTFTGTLTNINAALNGMKYLGNLNYNGADALRIDTNDLGNTGSGGPQTSTSIVNLNVLAVNDAPINAVPVAQTVAEDTALVFSAANGNAISISDVDAGSGLMKVTLSVVNGTLTFSDLTFLSGSNGTKTMTFTGSISDINHDLLNGLTYQGKLNFNGSDTLTIITNDQGNTGLGGAKSDTDKVAITVTAVNDAPVIHTPNTSVNPITANEDTALIFSTSKGTAISITDVDAGTGALQVTLTVTHGTLTLNTISGLAFTTGDGIADPTMTFKGSLSAINSALNGMKYLADLNYNGPASLSIATDDQGNTGSGGHLSDSNAVAINVVAVNDAPVNSVPTTQQTVAENSNLVFSTARGNVISISDIDLTGNNTSNPSYLEQVTLTVSHGTLSVSNTSGLTALTGNNSATLVLTGTIDAINAALAGNPLLNVNGLTYRGALNYSGSDTLKIVTNDQGNIGIGGAKIDTDAVAIKVTVVNDIPVNNVPSSQSTNEDTALIFSAVRGNAITISDADAGTSPLKVTLTVADGDLTLGSIAGLSFTAGDGLRDASMTFTGTLSAINSALNGLTYRPTADYNGADTLTITTNDQGNTGSGGPQESTSTVSISVTAVNDAPANTVPDAQTVDEDTALVFSTANGKAISSGDVDANGQAEQVTLTVNHGILTLGSDTSGLVSFSNNGSATVTLTGTITAINNALDGLTYLGASNYYGFDTLTISTNDLGNTGINGAQTVNTTVQITVNSVNDAPVNTVPDAQTVNEDTALVFSSANHNAISVNDVDINNGSELVTLHVLHGTLTLSTTNGVFVTGNGTDTVTLNGDLNGINTALDGLTYQGILNFNGADTLTITTNDQGNTGSSGAQTTITTVNIAVSAVNDAPIVATAIDDQNINGGTAFNLAVAGTFSDVDVGDHLTYTATLPDGSSLPSWLQFDGSAFSGTPSNSDVGNFIVRVTASDGTASVYDEFTITVASANSAPTVDQGISAQNATEDSAFSFAVPGNAFKDVDVGDHLTYTATLANGSPLPSWLHFDGTTFTGTPTNDDVGSISVRVTATDTSSASVSTNFTLNVINTNDAPIVDQGISAQNATEDSAFSFAVPGNAFKDVDVGDHLTYTATLANGSPLPSWLHFDGTTFTGTPTNDDVGSISVRVTATDTSNASVFDDFTIIINGVNDFPVNSVPSDQTVDQNTDLVFSSANNNLISISDVDANGGAEKVTLTVSNGILTLSQTTGLAFLDSTINGSATMTFAGTIDDINAALNGMAYHSNSSFAGSDTLQITTNDQGNTGIGGSLTDSDTINITVNAVIPNEAPVAHDDAYFMPTGETLVPGASHGVLANDIDANNDTLSATFVLGSGPANGTLTLNSDGSFVYTPNAGFLGIDSFTYYANDGTVDSDNVATVTIQVSTPHLFSDGQNWVDLNNVSSSDPFNPAVDYWALDSNDGYFFDFIRLPDAAHLDSHSTFYNSALANYDPSNIFYGGAGSDTIIGRDLNDFINGGASSDSLVSGVAHDVIEGGADADYIYINPNLMSTDYIAPGSSADLFNPVAQVIDESILGNDSVGSPSNFNTTNPAYLNDQEAFSTAPPLSLSDSNVSDAIIVINRSDFGSISGAGWADASDFTNTALPSVRVQGTLADATDLDLYKVTLHAGETFIADVDHTNFSSDLTLYDANGNAVAFSEYNSYNYEMPNNGDIINSSDGFFDYSYSAFLTYTALASGDYYLRIANDYFANDAGSNDPYIINMSIKPETSAMDNSVVSYESSPEGVTIDLSSAVIDSYYGVPVVTGQGGDAEGDQIYNAHNILGSAFNDRLTGDDYANWLRGGAGNDTLIYNLKDSTGYAPRDIYDGGTGNDTLVINTSQATLDQLGLTAQDIMDYFNAHVSSGSVDFANLNPNINLIVSNVEHIQVANSSANLPPVATAIANQSNVDTASISFDVSSYFSDPNGDTLSFSASGLPAGLSINSVGLISGTFDSTDYQSGPFSVTVTASDGNGGSTNASFLWTVTAQPPIVHDETFSATEGVPLTAPPTLSVASNDVDPYGGTLTYVLVDPQNAPAGLTFNSDGTFSFDTSNSAYAYLTANQPNPLTIAYIATDSHGGTAQGTLTIDLVGTNSPPTFTLSQTSVTSDDGSSINFNIISNITDPDDTSGFTVSTPQASLPGSLPAGLSMDSSGNITGTLGSSDSQHGPYTVTVTVSDSHGGSSSQDFTWVVNNPAPVFLDAHPSISGVYENSGIITGSLANTVSDPDHDQLIFTPTFVAPGFTLNADGSYSFDTSNAAYDYLTAADTITRVGATYTVTDADGAAISTSGEFDITITGVNDPPRLTVPDQTSQDGAAISLNILSYVNDPDSDGAISSISVSGLPTGLSFNSGVISGTLTNSDSASSPYTVTITATDNHGATSSQDFIWTITNPAPVAVSDSETVTQGSGIFNGSVAGDASDPDNDTLHFAANGTTPGFSMNDDGSYTLDTSNSAYAYLAPSDPPLDIIIPYTVTDAQGATATATLTLTMTGVNDAPVTTQIADQFSLEGETISFDTAAYFKDPEHDSLSYSVSMFLVVPGVGEYKTGPALPTGLDITPEGVIYGTITNSAASDVSNGIYYVHVTADDHNGGTSEIDFQWTVTNPAPVAEPATGSATEGFVLTDSVANSSHDPDGDALTFSFGGPYPADFTPGVNNDGSYTFDATDPAYNSLAAGQTTDVVIPYTVTDADGASSSSTLTITVIGVNDAPTANANNPITNQSIAEDTPFNFTIPTNAFSDPDSTLTYTYSATLADNSNFTGFTLNPTTGVFSGTPPQDYNGDIIITVTASDGQYSANSSFTLTVTPVNDPPVAEDDSYSTVQNNLFGANVLDNDTDVDTNHFALTAVLVNGQGPAHAQSFTWSDDGSFIYNPATDFAGTDTFTYQAFDGTDYSAVTTVTIEVNGPPVAVADTYEVDENSIFTVTTPDGVMKNDSDPNHDLLTAYLYMPTSNGDLTFNDDGSFSYTPYTSFVGTDTFQYYLSDGYFSSNFVTVTLNVNYVPLPPVAMADSKNVDEDTTLVVAASQGVLANDSDIDGDTLHVTQFTVAGDNTNTIYNAGSQAAIAGIGSLTLNSDGSYTFVPVANYNGAVPVVIYTVADSNGDTSTSTLTISVNPVNDPPVARADSNSVDEDTTLNVSPSHGVLANDSDIDVNTTLTVTQFIFGSTYNAGQTATLDGVGSLVINSDGSYIFTPAANYTGNVPAISYTVTDGNGGYDNSTLTISITPVNDAPAGTDKTVSTPEDTPYILRVADFGFTDPLDNPANNFLAVKITSLPSVGSLLYDGVAITASQVAAGYFVSTADIQADKLVFTPEANANGVNYDSFTFQVQDDGGTANGGVDTSTSANTMTITVTPVNDPPIAYNDSYTAQERITSDDSPLVVASGAGVLWNDTDIDSSSLTAFLAVLPTHGTLSVNPDGSYINPDGSFTYTPDVGFYGTDSFQYAAFDGEFTSPLATVTITVLQTNFFDAGDNTVDFNALAALQPPQSPPTITAIDYYALAGDDTVILPDATSADIISYGHTDHTAIISAALTNKPYSDIFYGGDGNDSITGGNLDDIIEGGTGFNYIDGGTGNNTVSYTTFDSLDQLTGVTVFLNDNGTGLGSGTNAELTPQSDTLANIQNIIGSAYNDTLMGDSNDNILIGGAGNDTLQGGAGNDILIGGMGDDLLDGGAGADTLYGGDGGTDTVTYANSGAGVNVNLFADTISSGLTASGGDAQGDTFSSIEKVIGSSYDDTITGDNADNTFYGGLGNDTLNGGAGSDTLYGGDGNDTLSGGTGNDFLYGEGGDDTLDGGAGADVLDGGSGVNTVTYENSHFSGPLYSSGVTVNLATGFASGGDATGDTLINIQNIIGSNYSDTLTGDSGDNTLTGGKGDDNLKGGDGNDTLYGGNSTDTLMGSGNDTLDGGAGNDTLYGGDGRDTLIGGAGIDFLYGGIGNDILEGDAGSNFLDGGADEDTVTYDWASQSVSVNLLTGVGVHDGVFVDTLTSIEDVTGGKGDDTLIGDNNANVLSGGGGNDTLVGGGGNDILLGGAGDDILEGGAGADTLNGGDGTDTVTYANSPYSTIITTTDGKYLYLGVTVDLSADTVSGSATASGGDAQGDTFSSIEVVIGSNYDDTITGDSADNVLSGGAGDDKLYGHDGNDTLSGGTGSDELYGDAGNDTLDGGDDNDFMYGGAGDDTFIGGGGADQMYGGADNTDMNGGINTVTYDASPEAMAGGGGVIVDLYTGTGRFGDAEGDTYFDIQNVTGSAFNDTLIGDDANNTLLGGAGDDTLEGHSGNDTLDGGTGNNTVSYAYLTTGATIDISGLDPNDPNSSVQVTVDANDVDTLRNIQNIIGGDGNDTLIGNSADNILTGGAGDDTLEGGLGNDILNGGSGFNTVSYAYLSTGVTVDFSSAFLITDVVDPFYGLGRITVNAGTEDSDTLLNIQGVIGSSHNDTFIGGAGANTFDGGAAGSDTVSYAYLSHGVTVDLSTTNQDGSVTVSADELAFDIDKLISIENIIGTNYDDTFISDAGANTFDGGTGGFDTVSYENSGSNNNDGITGVTVNLATHTNSGGYAEGDHLTHIQKVIGSNYDDVLTADGNGDTLEGGDGNDQLYGGAGDDTLQGGAGNDTLYGSIGGNDTVSYAYLSTDVTVDLSTTNLDGSVTVNAGTNDVDTLYNFRNVIGGDGNDTLIGNSGDNALYGGAGDDTLIGGAGADHLDGGAGFNNTASYEHSASNNNDGITGVTVNLATGTGTGANAQGDTLINIQIVTGSDFNDTLIGSANTDTFYAGAGNDTISGDAGADILYGEAGNDTLDGGAGDDFLDGGDGDDILIGGAGADILNGGAGVNTADYSASSIGVSVNLFLGKGTNGDAEDDILNNIQVVIGSNSNDVLVGNNTADTLYGGAGIDVLYGGDGNDTLYGGAGADTLDGGADDDTLIGGAGADTLDGSAGFNTADYSASGSAVTIDLVAGTGSGGDAEGDQLFNIQKVIGSSHADTFFSAAAANTFIGNGSDDGFDTVSYERSTSAVTINLTTGTGSGGYAEGDILTGIEAITGSNFDDTFIGAAGANTFNGSDGNDTVSYAYLTAGAGVTVDLSTADINGNVIVNAGSGDVDTLISIENIIGGAGDDILTGDSGANVIEGGLGNDTINGGDGNDTVSYAYLTAGVTVDLSTTDINGNVIVTAGSGDVDSVRNIENIIGGDGNDTLIGDSGNNILYGGDGNDTLTGGAGDDTLYGGNNDDTLIGGVGADYLDGGTGFNTVSYNLSNDAVIVNLANHTATGGDAAGDTLVNIQAVIGSANDDTLTGDSANNTLYGLGGDDTLNGGDGNNTLYGGDGDDTLTSGAGDDILDGGNGNDTLIGGAGNNTLYGGDGNDTASYEWATQGIIVDLRPFDSSQAGMAIVGNNLDHLYDIENIIGGSGNDTLIGTSGINRLYGGSGDDILQGGGDNITQGGDYLDGGDGFDTVDYSTSNHAMTIHVYADTDSDGSYFVSIEKFIGSNYNDTFDGSDANDILDGGIGNDLINGRAGADILTGGVGEDTFKFDADSSFNDVITDFTPADGDRLDLSAFGIHTASDPNLTIIQDGNNTVLTIIDANHVITLQHTSATSVQDSSFTPAA